MPIHDVYCENCDITFEEYHQSYETVICPDCFRACKTLISKLADFTGVHTTAVKDACSKLPAEYQKGI